METRYSYFIRLGLILADFFMVNLSYLVGYLVVHLMIDRSLSAHFVLSKILIFNLGWLTLASMMKLYSRETIAKIEMILRQTIKTFFLHAAFFAVFLLYSEEKSFAIRFMPVAYTSLLSLLALRSILVTYVIERILQHSGLHTRTAIVGYNPTALRLATYFMGKQNAYTFEGFLDEQLDHYYEFGKSAGRIEQYIQFAAANDIQEIYSTVIPESTQINRLMEIADQNCVRVKFVPDFSGAIETSYFIEYLDAIPVISLRQEPLRQDIGNMVKKRAFDIAFSSFVIIFIMSWLTPLLAILIKLDSKGPVFFRQLRSGRDNKPFWCYKFRSMRVNFDSDKIQATRGDRRITKLGAFLRKTNLDEMPQFFNVFRGTMSVVGPRPHMLAHTEQYSAIIGKYMVRQFLQPGITGWAQVNGYRGETKNPEQMVKRVEYDIYYMEHWSWMFDLRIIFLTIINTVKGEKNAF
jgi:putative colanic acid biosynthesis UDP-glucose lipid carrier transferase